MCKLGVFSVIRDHSEASFESAARDLLCSYLMSEEASRHLIKTLQCMRGERDKTNRVELKMDMRNETLDLDEPKLQIEPLDSTPGHGQSIYMFGNISIIKGGRETDKINLNEASNDNILKELLRGKPEYNLNVRSPSSPDNGTASKHISKQKSLAPELLKCSSVGKERTKSASTVRDPIGTPSSGGKGVSKPCLGIDLTSEPRSLCNNHFFKRRLQDSVKNSSPSFKHKSSDKETSSFEKVANFFMETKKKKTAEKKPVKSPSDILEAHIYPKDYMSKTKNVNCLASSISKKASKLLLGSGSNISQKNKISNRGSQVASRNQSKDKRQDHLLKSSVGIPSDTDLGLNTKSGGRLKNAFSTVETSVGLYGSVSKTPYKEIEQLKAELASKDEFILNLQAKLAETMEANNILKDFIGSLGFDPERTTKSNPFSSTVSTANLTSKLLATSQDYTSTKKNSGAHRASNSGSGVDRHKATNSASLIESHSQLDTRNKAVSPLLQQIGSHYAQELETAPTTSVSRLISCHKSREKENYDSSPKEVAAKPKRTLEYKYPDKPPSSAGLHKQSSRLLNSKENYISKVLSSNIRNKEIPAFK